jgi:hypothetical protein
MRVILINPTFSRFQINPHPDPLPEYRAREVEEYRETRKSQ